MPPTEHETLHDVQLQLAALNGKLDMLILRLNLDEKQREREDLVNRVSKLERRDAWMLGAGAALGLVAGFVGHLLQAALTH